jgi:ABC-type lipoprotein release transport system permease subunit
VANELRNKLGHSYYVVSWADLNGNLFSLIEMEKWLIFLVFCFLILIAAINCISTVSTTILDRRREIAILKTIGVTFRQIRRIMFIRIMSVCALSISGGLAIGSLAAWAITRQSLYQLKGDVYFIDKIYTSVSPLNYAILFLMSVLIISLCIRFPLRSIDRLEIVEILRGR